MDEDKTGEVTLGQYPTHRPDTPGSEDEGDDDSDSSSVEEEEFSIITEATRPEDTRKPCIYVNGFGGCRNTNEACAFSHRYEGKPCKAELGGDNCPYGTKCWYVHSSTQNTKPPPQKPCRYGLNCKKRDTCAFTHGDGMDGGPVQDSEPIHVEYQTAQPAQATQHVHPPENTIIEAHTPVSLSESAVDPRQLIGAPHQPGTSLRKRPREESEADTPTLVQSQIANKCRRLSSNSTREASGRDIATKWVQAETLRKCTSDRPEQTTAAMTGSVTSGSHEQDGDATGTTMTNPLSPSAFAPAQAVSEDAPDVLQLPDIMGERRVKRHPRGSPTLQTNIRMNRGADSVPERRQAASDQLPSRPRRPPRSFISQINRHLSNEGASRRQQTLNHPRNTPLLAEEGSIPSKESRATNTRAVRRGRTQNKAGKHYSNPS